MQWADSTFVTVTVTIGDQPKVIQLEEKGMSQFNCGESSMRSKGYPRHVSGMGNRIRFTSSARCQMTVTKILLAFTLSVCWQNNARNSVTAESIPVDCTDPNGYRVVEILKGEVRYVEITQGDKVLGSIRVLTDRERNGFALDEAKKTSTGFEIAVEYGSRYYYHKQFIFICQQQKFYLSKVIVDSFDKQNPEHSQNKVIRIKPLLPLEKFVLENFMMEGVVKQKPAG